MRFAIPEWVGARAGSRLEFGKGGVVLILRERAISEMVDEGDATPSLVTVGAVTEPVLGAWGSVGGVFGGEPRVGGMAVVVGGPGQPLRVRGRLADERLS